ncbi:MAG: 16S rRNA (uracil(1498)-N(3))-methyltransferase [Proteobacteria bacterium]|nr:16S rRNA (uracil(1498)-N(3))-methyltransferase [Pseudomonadota bacterium]
MRLHRIYYPFIAEVEQNVLIENQRAHYLRNVLRLKIGNNLKIFNHQGQEFLAEIVALNKKTAEVHLIKPIQTIPPSKLNITLIQSLSKGERMDYTVQKATELGIATIQPITSEYCEVKLKGARLEKKLEHWKNIIISACEQSFRTDIPAILAPLSIQEYCQTKHQGILLEPEENKTTRQVAKYHWQQFDIVIGPEGGWSPQDLSQLKSTELTGIQFGQRILRTETMAPAILAAIHSLWGDFV